MPILYKHKHKLHPLNGYKISDKYCGANTKKKKKEKKKTHTKKRDI